ncbi:sensor histidine kinase [Tenuifilaceae bacterium CYCD]|nr:sensor histidine kinase [Tenuifilaceae bacterium CYCD]
MRVGDYDSGCIMAKRLIQFCNKEVKSPPVNSLLCEGYNYLGVYNSEMRNIDSSIVCYKRAIEQACYSSKPSQIANLYINIADVYTQKSDYVSSVYYYRRALQVSDSLKIVDQLAFPIYFGLGQAYFGIAEYDLSDRYFRQAEKGLENRTLSEKFTFCNNRGNYYYYKGEYDAALPWFQRARELVLPHGYKFHIALCEGNLGDILCKLNQFDSAYYYLNNSYSYFKSINHYPFLYYLATVNAELALKQGNPKLAEQWILQYSKTDGIDPQFIALRNKLMQQYCYNVAKYRQAYDYLLRNVQIDDSIRSERVKGRVAELDMRYKQDTLLLRKNLLIQEQQTDLENLRLTKYFWISVFVVFLLIGTFTFLYLRKKNDLLRLKHLNQISKLRMESVRSRISPHFVFNVLNHEIISEKNEAERSELRGLVKLLRHSLEVTESLCVPLSKELDFVKTYINIERNSLGDDFVLQWEVDERIDCDGFMLPSMIVQIPVENAIKHALRGMDGQKELRVAVAGMEYGVAISITDNGVGFNRAPVERKGTGTGLKVIYQTIELLNAQNEQKIEFSISAADNSANGTKVSIYIPKNYSYQI